VLLDNLYQGNFAVAASADGWAAMWLYSCGVLQGCPLSGFVFVVATDAMLRGMCSSLSSRGHSLLRAAADDLGAALQRMSDLLALRPIFKIMQLAAGLTLKAEKCILVPLDGPVTMHKLEIIRGWLRHHCPEWAAFKIVSHSRYLGIIMGPGAGERSWAAPLIKYNDRCGAIAASRGPPALATWFHNVRAVTVLQYVAQVQTPPASLFASSMVAFNRVLKAPGSFVSECVGTMLDELDLKPFASPTGQCLAALLRTALDGKLEWRSLICELENHNLENVALRRFADHLLWDPHWLAPPFAVTLASAAGQGLPLRVHDAWIAPLAAGRAAASAAASTAGVHKHIQAAASRAISDARHASGVFELWITKRLVTLFGLDAVRTLNINDIMTALKKCPTRLKYALLRSWGNGWTTSVRMHSTDVRCLLGCDAPDSIQHYFSCPRLQNAITEALERIPPLCPLAAAGLSPIDHERPVLACILYHIVKGLSGVPLSRLLRLPELACAAARDVRARRAPVPALSTDQ
jgi:hypothetical protein